MSQTLFWDVDTQVDFMDTGGKLYVPGAENIIPRIQQLTQFAAEHRIPIVASACAHVPSDPEFSQYPPHCLVGTPGQQKVAGSLLPDHYIIPNRKIELPGNIASYPQLIVEKQATDVFSNPNTDSLLARLAAAWHFPPASTEVVLYGVVTEICVELAARGLIQSGYRMTILSDAIQHLSPERGKATIEYVEQHGGRALSSSALLSGRPVPASR